MVKDNIKIFSINTELNKVTGVQKVLIDIHNGIKGYYDAKIIGIQDFNNINPANNIEKDEYLKLKNIFLLRNSIVIVHERKLSSILLLLNKLLFLKMDIIYIHHNVFDDKRKMSFFPRNVVSISDKVTNNLVSFFRVPSLNITKIHNGIIDRSAALINNLEERVGERKIKILYAARINNVKRQDVIVNHLMNKLDSRLEVIFAGDGPNLDRLRDIVGKNPQFKVLGFVEDMVSLMNECDYIMLFSTHEGLSISLIEATMCGKPIITNDVGGNLEIITQNESAFIASDWDDLISILNNLPYVSAEKYNQMSLKSRKEYEEKFQYEKMVEKYKCLIDQIINEHK